MLNINEETRMVELNYDIVVNLVFDYIYNLFLLEGRNQTYEQIVKHFKAHDFEYTSMIRDGYDMACELYDENEGEGWHEEQYPWRFDSRNKV